MEWSKVKTILIIVLLGVNLFMLISFFCTLQNENKIEKDALEAAVEEANSAGLSLSLDGVPGKTKEIVSYEVPRDEAREAAIAESLVGGYTLETPGAGITVYHGEKGNATFRSTGNFEIVITEDAVPPESEEDAERLAEELWDLAGIGNRRLLSVKKTNGYSVTFEQTLLDKGLVNSIAEIQFSDTSVSITGRWVFGSPLSTGETPKNSSELILLLKNELKKQGLLPMEVISINAEYTSGAATGGRIKLLPVWNIIHKGGQSYFDTVRGVLVFVE